MHRSFDPEVMRQAMAPYPDINPLDYDYACWLGNLSNVMLVEEDDVGLATYDYPGAYTGHFFLRSRGKQAISTITDMLDMMFTDYGAEVMRGLTKTTLRPALWMNRRLGFKSLGVVETDTGPHELFYLTKSDFYEGKN